ncbi:MAG: signal peptide peptidase SppA [Candidatus Sumerlaeia bacterium]|nr:signal peptide peptidase SppA [Candidatus Sumerlaeia bacterium]
MRSKALVLLLSLPSLSGCIVIPGLSSLMRQDMEEVIVEDSDRLFVRDKILLLDISGVISEAKEEQVLSEGTSLVEDVRESLRLAREDPRIRAVIVRIDSPGGTVTASDLIHHELRRYAEETGVPITAMLMDVAASGGYYVASAADRIVASPTTVTGSIGVIMLTVDVQGLEDLVGVQVGAVTSGPFKDIMSPFRPMTGEEREILQSVIDGLYGRFVETVVAGREGRGLSAEDVRGLADGRIFTAQQALDAGLVDSVGYLPELIDELTRELGLDDPQVVAHRRGAWGRYNVYSQLPRAPVVNVNLLSADSVTQGLGPGFHYLWMPGALRLSRR